MTSACRDSITLRLVTEGYDVENPQRSARVEKLIAKCRASSSTGQVRVFGEMVSLLWNSNLGATISLEEMWNEIIDRNSISLMCTYALDGRNGIPDSRCSLHTHSMTCVDIAA